MNEKRLKGLPWALAFFSLAWLVMGFQTPKAKEGFDIAGFSRLPILHGGRLKPIDTLARSSLLMLRGKQTIRWEKKSISANEWVLDMFYRPEEADRYPVFEINDPDVTGLLGLASENQRHFAMMQLKDQFPLIAAQAQQAQAQPANQRDRFQSAILTLRDRITLYAELQGSYVLAADPVLRHAWQTHEPAPFNERVAMLTKSVQEVQPEAARHGRSEFLFNQGALFYRSLVLYVCAFVLASFFWLTNRDILRRSADSLLWMGYVAHTIGLLWRMIIQGRPPVTNLYSSAIFVGWVAAGMGLLLERRRRDGIAGAVAAAIGFATLIIAHHLATQGDTLEMMRAVLDSNFWLATHVTTITIGYASTFVTGLFGIVFLIRRLVDSRWSDKTAEDLERTIFGVACFSLFFSFLGTILGGIWADQSWGRFWGWDPKENGALMIVLWNAFLLHARVGRTAGPRGMALMAVFGNIVTAFSWFGVNMLGIGLHSYGFMDKAFVWLVIFTFSQLAIMTLAPIRRRT